MKNYPEEDLFDEIYNAFKHGVKVGIEEGNYIMIKKLAQLNINITLISELTDTPIKDVLSILTENNTI